MCAPNWWDNDRRTIQFLEEAIDLLAIVTGTGLDIDLENIKALAIFYDNLLFETIPPPLVTVQSATISFAQRFSITIESDGWHPDFFAATFCDQEWNALATQATEEGRTALHWAAAHYGLWLMRCSATPWIDGFSELPDDLYEPDIRAPGVAKSYANLAIALIRKGSDVHKSWNKPLRWHSTRNASPFLSFLEGLYTYRGWDAACLSDAVHRWGQLLIDAGQPLLEYAATETVFLRANPDGVSILDGEVFFAVELEVLEDDRLTLRIQRLSLVDVWKAEPTFVPGAWPASLLSPNSATSLPELPDKIIWRPEDEDEQEGFRWVPVELVSLKTQPHLVEPPDTTRSHRLDFVFPGTLKTHAGRQHISQDDHDPSVVIMSNDHDFRQANKTCPRRRSASAPPINVTKQLGREMYLFPKPWGGVLHRCALDLRWKMSSTTSPSLRDCLQGRCRDRTKESPDAVNNNWETWLMRQENHIQVAKRFAQRLCPQHLDMVEMTSARATERAQLAMAPARPPARSR